MATPIMNFFKLFWKQLIVSFLFLVYLAVNLFQIGGDAFVINVNNFIVVPLALVVSFLALLLWRQNVTGSQNRFLWLGLTIGWVLWTIAEVWWAFTSFIEQEVPYPSWIDFFWLAGYIPMYLALGARIRSLPKLLHPIQRVGIRVVALICAACTVLFIIIPILQNSDPAAIFESTINILYPLADTVLLILVLQIFFSYEQGMYGRAWRWLTLGFISFSIGDLFFAYASTADLYYPDQQVNLISSLGSDIPYNLSYLFCMIGLIILHAMHKTYRIIAQTGANLKLVPDTHLLVFTKGDDTVMDVSRNFEKVFSENTVHGKTIQEVLGISNQDADTLLKEIKEDRVFKERMFYANTRSGREQVWVSGIAAISPQREYLGVYLLLRMLTGNSSFDILLTAEEKGMVRSLLAKTGTEQREQEEIKQLLADYYQTFINSFYNHTFTEGGSMMADAFTTELQLIVSQQGWQMEIQPNSLLDVSRLSLDETKTILPILFEAAWKFIVKLTGPATADAIVQEIRSKFGEGAIKNISLFSQARADPA